jgi:hypothetical protein
MPYRVELYCPGNVDAEELMAAFRATVAIFDATVGEPCSGSISGSDDRGPNPTEHIRPEVNGFYLSAEDARG